MTLLNQKILPLFLIVFGFWAYSEEVQPPSPTALEKFFPFILIALFFYFILIRPAQKKQQAQSQFLNTIKKGDEVLTNGGIYGRIQGMTDDFVTLEVAEEVCIRVLKSQISRWKSKETEKSSERSKKPIKKIKA